jgi:hypothetical protein
VQQVQVRSPDAPGQPVVVTQVPAGVPQTPAEYRLLVSKRSQLSDQLISATGRRNDLAAQLLTTDASARDGIQARLKVLDDRIVRLEMEIDQTGQQVANAAPQIMSSTTISPSRFMDRMGDQIVPIAGMLSLFVLFPLAIALARSIWRRSASAGRPVPADHGTQQRLEQIQQAIDSIAIEVERISENQRFVTKMVSERERVIGAGAAEPLRSSVRSGVASERG